MTDRYEILLSFFDIVIKMIYSQPWICSDTLCHTASLKYKKTNYIISYYVGTLDIWADDYAATTIRYKKTY